MLTVHDVFNNKVKREESDIQPEKCPTCGQYPIIEFDIDKSCSSKIKHFTYTATDAQCNAVKICPGYSASDSVRRWNKRCEAPVKKSVTVYKGIESRAIYETRDVSEIGEITLCPYCGKAPHVYWRDSIWRYCISHICVTDVRRKELVVSNTDLHEAIVDWNNKMERHARMSDLLQELESINVLEHRPYKCQECIYHYPNPLYGEEDELRQRVECAKCMADKKLPFFFASSDVDY